VDRLLRSDDFRQRLPELKNLPARQVINPLFSFLCSPDETVKMRAVAAIGVVVAQLANEDMESARVIMRRLIWNLNDESGGIGWGCPEAMGEIMASHEGLAKEYAPILISFIREDGNFFEYEPLLCGALWGVGRLAQVRPQLVKDSVPHVRSFLKSQNDTIKELAKWTLNSLGESTDVRE
jgi:hypothetical protein